MPSTREPPKIKNAAHTLCTLFILGTWMTMVALFVLRIQWTAWVWIKANSGAREIDRGFYELPEPILRLGEIEIIAYDASIKFYLFLTSLFIVFILFARRNIASAMPQLLFTLKALFIYSVTMIMAQILYLSLLGLGEERENFVYNSFIVYRGKEVVSISDPHIATALIAIFALGVLASPAVISYLKKLLASLAR